jgi:hypothetical protein
MLKIRFENPVTNNQNEIVWHNLKQADNNLDLNIFCAASYAWLKINPDKSFQDLEFELRKRDFNTHLIAKKPHLNKDFKIVMQNKYKCEKFLYECIYSCRPKKYAIKELLETWNSYDENFQNLASTGTICPDEIEVNPDNINDGGVTKYYNDETMNNLKLIMDMKKMVYIDKLNVDDIIEATIYSIKEKYGEEPTHSLYGMTNSGGPIIVFTIDNKIVADIGYTIGYNTQGNKIINIIKL